MSDAGQNDIFNARNTDRHEPRKDHTMFETSAHPAIRNGLAQAHAERGAAFAQAWTWLFGGKTSR